MDEKAKNRVIQSIAPDSIVYYLKNPHKVQDIFILQQEETINFKKDTTKGKKTAFIKHVKNKTLKIINEHKIIEDYREKIKMHWNIETYRLSYVSNRINITEKDIDYMIEISQAILNPTSIIAKKYQNNKINLTKEEFKNYLESTNQQFRIRTIIYGMITSHCSDLFYIHESNCKLLCMMGCPVFSLQLLKKGYIQHQQIWRTLKNIGGEKKGTTCSSCFAKNTCGNNIPFSNLANLYASMIKLRMLADYSLHTFDNLTFFKNLKKYSLPAIKNIHSLNQELIPQTELVWSPASDKDYRI